jgi:hypothetical protein
MSTTSKVMYSVQAFDKVSKDTDRDMEATGSIFFQLKPYIGFDASFNCFFLKPIYSKVERDSTSA